MKKSLTFRFPSQHIANAVNLTFIYSVDIEESFKLLYNTIAPLCRINYDGDPLAILPKRDPSFTRAPDSPRQQHTGCRIFARRWMNSTAAA